MVVSAVMSAILKSIATTSSREISGLGLGDAHARHPRARARPPQDGRNGPPTTRPLRSGGPVPEAAACPLRPRLRRGLRARDVTRRRPVRRAEPVSTFRGPRLRRGARPATRGTSTAAPADPCAEAEARALLRRAGSTHRRSEASGRVRRPFRRRESPARPPRAATRRRVAIEPAGESPRATQTRRSPRAARFPPSVQTRQPPQARKRGVSVERARGALRLGQSSEPPRSTPPGHARPPSGWRRFPSSRRT